jgi:hypothetical protein
MRMRWLLWTSFYIVRYNTHSVHTGSSKGTYARCRRSLVSFTWDVTHCLVRSPATWINLTVQCVCYDQPSSAIVSAQSRSTALGKIGKAWGSTCCDEIYCSESQIMHLWIVPGGQWLQRQQLCSIELLMLRIVMQTTKSILHLYGLR